MKDILYALGMSTAWVETRVSLRSSCAEWLEQTPARGFADTVCDWKPAAPIRGAEMYMFICSFIGCFLSVSFMPGTIVGLGL